MHSHVVSEISKLQLPIDIRSGFGIVEFCRHAPHDNGGLIGDEDRLDFFSPRYGLPLAGFSVARFVESLQVSAQP